MVSTRLEESVKVIAKALNEEGPFDGVFGFSQGAVIFRYFYKLANLVDQESIKIIHPFPRFMISYSGLVFDGIILKYKGKYYP